MTTVVISSIQLTVPITAGPGNPRDWVGLFRPGDANNQMLDWKYLANNSNKIRPDRGTTTGSVTLEASNPTMTYEVRFLSASGLSDYIVISKSQPFTFGPWPSNIFFVDSQGNPV